MGVSTRVMAALKVLRTQCRILNIYPTLPRTLAIEIVTNPSDANSFHVYSIRIWRPVVQHIVDNCSWKIHSAHASFQKNKEKRKPIFI